MNAHFFDISTAIYLNSKVWVVSKIRPNEPVLKISQSDFNLIKKGIFKSNGDKLSIGGKEYWIKNELINAIKIKCKKLNIEITDLVFSMREFLNPNVIEDLDYKIYEEHFLNLKNTNDDIYIICSKNTEKNYKIQIEKLEEFLLRLGLKVKDYYYLSETFYNRDEDKISHKKCRLLLQHLLGLKTEDIKFTDKEIKQYDNIYFYDDERNSISMSKNINDILKFLTDNSDKLISERIIDIIKEDKTLYVNEVTFNKVNPFSTTKVVLSLDRIIKTFERFINKF